MLHSGDGTCHSGRRAHHPQGLWAHAAAPGQAGSRSPHRRRRNTTAATATIAADHDGDLTPADGERLWYVDITWTNNLPEVVGKECHGPYAMDLRAYDLQGREMLEVDQPGYIEGQECSTGLMQGQTGRWQTAFRGLGEEFGWLAFDDYNGEEVLVTLDQNLGLYYED